AACGGGGGDSSEFALQESDGLDDATLPADTVGTGGETTVHTKAGTAMIGWNATPDSNVVGYRLYYGTAPGAYEQPKGSGIETGNVNAYLVENLASGQTYYFAVTAIDAAGGESGYSKEVSRTIQ